jgi:hypothetical protein
MLVSIMKHIAISLLAALALPAVAQTPSTATSRPAAEVVMDASGKIVAPWTKGKSCTRQEAGKETCRWVVVNGQTREIARVGDKWSSKFAPTGRGREVRRIESSLDKATRLSGSSLQ